MGVLQQSIDPTIGEVFDKATVVWTTEYLAPLYDLEKDIINHFHSCKIKEWPIQFINYLDHILGERYVFALGNLTVQHYEMLGIKYFDIKSSRQGALFTLMIT